MKVGLDASVARQEAYKAGHRLVTNVVSVGTIGGTAYTAWCLGCNKEVRVDSGGGVNPFGCVDVDGP